MALLISVFLILFAGLCSGLTVGYLSIKKQNLMIWLDSSDEYKIKVAKTILGVLENHHLLLSTLLLSNALAMEALPIFLDKIVPAFAAILISTVSVLIFGEVIPQAYCTGSHQIPIAYYMSSFVKLLEFVFAIFVRPIAWLLDTWLGHHEDKIVLDKSNLKTLLQLHKSKEFGYTPEEIELLQNTLDLRSKKV
jgi:metal transporter CNNM